jgi:hypothetical protein
MSCSGSHLRITINIKNTKFFQNASSLKPLGQLKPNYPGMIIGRSSTKFLFAMPIGNPRWLPPQVIVLTQDQEYKPEALKSLYRSPGYKKKPIGPM